MLVSSQARPRLRTKLEVDQMLVERHLSKKAIRSKSKNHMKGPKKRTEVDDMRFKESFEKMVRTAEGLIRY